MNDETFIIRRIQQASGLTLPFTLVAQAVRGDQGREGVCKTVRRFLGIVIHCLIPSSARSDFASTLRCDASFSSCASQQGSDVKNCYSMTAHHQPGCVFGPRYLLKYRAKGG